MCLSVCVYIYIYTHTHSTAIGMTAGEPAELVLSRLKAERDDPLEVLVKHNIKRNAKSKQKVSVPHFGGTHASQGRKN